METVLTSVSVATRWRDPHVGLVAEIERMTADELDALSGAALWGVGDRAFESYAPGGEAGEREIGEDGGMGTPARLVVIVVSVVALASSAKPSPFRPSGGTANDRTLDVARRVLVERGFAVEASDKGAGVVATEWEVRDDNKHYHSKGRWVVTVDGGQFTVIHQCQERTMGDWGGLKDWAVCKDQREEFSVTARDIAIEIEERSIGNVTERAPVPAAEVCFEVSGEPARCFATWDECEAERDKRSGPTTGRCEAR
jgi:hypothetical protein